MRKLIFSVFLILLVLLSPARAAVLVPTLISWGINGNGPYLPGDPITASLSLTGTRTNPSADNSLSVSIYLSSRSNDITTPAIFLGSITAVIPGGSSGGGPTAQGTFTIPKVFNGGPFVTGNYYIVFNAVGATGSDTKSSMFSMNVPDISVEQPSGTGLVDGSSTVSFGEAAVAGTSTRNFVIRNGGSGALTGIAVTINGTNAADFSVTTAPATSIAAGSSSNFTVRFTAGAVGSRAASLHIASSVGGTKNPFDIALSGTGDAAPSAATVAATDVTDTGVTLRGTVNGNGATTAASFDYGATTGYGTNVAAVPAQVSGSTATAVSVAVSGLTPGATYHYRVNGISPGGTARGSDATFTTTEAPADVPSLPAWGYLVLCGATAWIGFRSFSRAERETDHQP